MSQFLGNALLGSGVNFPSAAAPGNGLLTDLVAYWKLDEASGDALDIHGSHTLAAVNAPGTGVGKVYTTARELLLASAQKFQSACEAVRTIAGPFTLAWWEKPYTYTGVGGHYNAIFDTGMGGGSGGLSVIHTHDGTIVLYLQYDGAYTGHDWSAHTVQMPTLNAWNYSIWTYNGATPGTITYQLNGGDVLTYTWADYAMTAGRADLQVRIGDTPGAGAYFDGLIGPIAIWTRVLSADDRAALWNNGDGLTYAEFTS